MTSQQNVSRISSILAILAMIFSYIQPSTAQAQSQNGDGLKRQVNAGSGKISFINPENGKLLSAPQALGQFVRPADPAMALAKKFGPEFGLKDPEKNLSELKKERGENGRLTVKYQQEYQGIPVIGGELIVNTNENGDLYSMNGEIASDLQVQTQPAIDLTQARETALQSVAKWNQKLPEDFTTTEPELWIFDESLLQPSTRPVELVWRMEVTPKDPGLPVRELVLVNAERGGVSLHFNQVDTAWTASPNLILNIQDTPPTSTPVWTEEPPVTPEPSQPTETTVTAETPGVSATSLPETVEPVVTESSPIQDAPQEQSASLTATTWYVTPTGNDSNSCLTAADPCRTINGAVGKAAIDGDLIKIAHGVYTGVGNQVVLINKNVNLSGGWDSNFVLQNDFSIIDGEKARRGITVGDAGKPDVSTVIDHFIVSFGTDGIQSTCTCSTLKVNDSAVIFNSGIGIGAMGPLHLNNVTVSNNAVGVVHTSLRAMPEQIAIINNSTITENARTSTATNQSSGISTTNKIYLSNTIISNNKVNGSLANCSTGYAAGIISNGNNIIDNTTGCYITPSAGDKFNVDPKLGVLFPSFGVRPILASSPAIDAGNNLTCYGSTDQRGIARYDGDGDTVVTCDIGAFEYTLPGPASILTVLDGDKQTTAPNRKFPLPFRIAISDDVGNPVNGINVNFAAPSSGASGTFDDTHTETTTITTATNGVVTALFTANDQQGAYPIDITTSFGSLSMRAENVIWYVSPAGLNSNSCKTPIDPCLTVDRAIENASDIGMIYVQNGTYTNPNISLYDTLLNINKNLDLIGGWDSGFVNQTGYSIIDGLGKGRVVVSPGKSVTLDRFKITSSLGIWNKGVLKLTNVIVNGNRDNGITNDGTITIENSSVSNNNSSGIHNQTGYVSASNTTISNNGWGGILTFGTSVTLNNTTVSGNKDMSGIYQGSGTVLIMNTLVSGNVSPNPHPDCSGEITSAGHNIIGNSLGCTISPADGDQFNIDPMLGPYIEQEGYNALSSMSPAIDAGDNATCYGATDQRGEPRNDGPDADSVVTCDIGSFEYKAPGSPSMIAYIDGEGQTVFRNTRFPKLFKVIVLDDNGNPAGAGIEVAFSAPTSGASGNFTNMSTTMSVLTDKFSVATASPFTSNSEFGKYEVTAAADGLAGNIVFRLFNAGWFVSPLGSDVNDCRTPSTACATINGIVNKGTTVGWPIYVAAGVYKGTGDSVVKLSSIEDTKFSGGWDASFTVQDGFSIIDGDGLRSGIVVESSATATFERFIVEHSRNDSIQKGGILNDGNLTLEDCEIRYNSTAYFGGGIHNRNRLILRDCFIRYNSAAMYGGGIYNQGDLMVIDSVIEQNSAPQGAGIYNTSFNGIGDSNLLNTLVKNNRASGDGGGIYNAGLGSVHLSNTGVNSNYAGNRGGGIVSSGTISTGNASIIDNKAVGQGGGILNFGKLILNTSTVSGNSSNSGGGVLSLPYDGTMEVSLNNTIIAGNYAQTSGHDCSGTLTSLGNNIIKNTASCSVTPKTGDLFNVDPQLGTFLPSEGYIPLLPTSPAINAGNPVTCTTEDQRKVSRPQGSKCDIGAYEYKTPGLVTRLALVSGDRQLVEPNKVFRNPLKVAALDNSGSPVSGVIVNYQAPVSSPSGVFVDNGTKTYMAVTKNSGIAESASFVADNLIGSYNVNASALGVASINISLHNGAWIVIPPANGGSDMNDCLFPNSACASLDGVLSKALFQDGDPIWMAIGRYGGSADQQLLEIARPVIIKGGWNSTFSNQVGTSVIQDTIDITAVIDVSLSRLTIQNTGFSGIRNFGNLIVENSTVRNNPATGIENSGKLTIINSTISQNGDNSLGWGYGGVYNSSSSPGSTIAILDSTITSNKGDTYGGVGNGGTQPITIQNTIIAGNIALYGKPYGQDCAGSLVSNGFNLVGNVGNVLAPTCIVDRLSTDQIGYYLYNQLGHFIDDQSVDAMLNVIQDFGNDVWVHPLTLGSPAIDAGPWNCHPLDQRWMVRPQGAYCDVGAYEYVFDHDANNLLITTYTAGNSTALPGTFVCNQTDLSCAAGDTHAKAAHQFVAGIYNFFKVKNNRNSIDGNGIELLSSVHYGSNYANAFWNGYLMVYGDKYSYPLADDVVAHEFTHGVTQYESNLFYYYQSGAINESFSDLWGEYYDQTNGQGNDTAGVKWRIGEDVSDLALQRSMSNPPAYNDPDKMTSPYYQKLPYYDAWWDNGGVHTNSGVNNKAVYLMVDGGTFNGKTVTPLGWDKVGAIYYEVQTKLLSSGADYSDLYYALQQACTSLLGQKGITAVDCAEIRDALDAVEMNAQPAPNFNPDAAVCSTGFPVIAFADDLETGTTNWTFNNGSRVRWQYDSPWGQYAQSGEHFLYADDYPQYQDQVTDARAKLKAFVVPNFAYLHFAHAYEFEFDSSGNYDGGVLEYSVNNGASWVDAGSLMAVNGYRGTINPHYINPLKGRAAFVGSSHGYISSRLNLASLAGKTVSFRWRMGLDDYGVGIGWWVDNIKIYTCGPDATFSDVPNTHMFWGYIEAFYRAGLTTGCSANPKKYCPDALVTRAEMATFIERAMGNFNPAPDPTGMFTDVPYPGLTHLTPFIEEFYNDRITTGCSQNPLKYCPAANVTRAEMATFIERALGNFNPDPNPTGMFADVPYPGLEHLTPFIEQFYNDGITTGCLANPLRYCPANKVTRQEMAVFIVRAFDIPLP